MTDKLKQYEKSLKNIEDKIGELISKLHTLKVKVDDALSDATRQLNINIQLDSEEVKDLLERIDKTLKLWKDYKEVFDSYHFARWLSSALDRSFFSAIERKIKIMLNDLVENYYNPTLKIDQIIDELDKLRKDIQYLRREVEFIKKLNSTALASFKLKIHDHKIHYEDELIPVALQVIKTYHGFYDLYKLDIHKRQNKLEFDAIALFLTESGNLRSVGIEAKENDIDKLAKQLLMRRPYVHYIYGIIWGNPATTILHLYKTGALDKLYDKGIGLIIVDYRGHPNIVLGSNYNPAGKIDIKKYLNLRSPEQP